MNKTKNHTVFDYLYGLSIPVIFYVVIYCLCLSSTEKTYNIPVGEQMKLNQLVDMIGR